MLRPGKRAQQLSRLKLDWVSESHRGVRKPAPHVHAIYWFCLRLARKVRSFVLWAVVRRLLYCCMPVLPTATDHFRVSGYRVAWWMGFTTYSLNFPSRTQTRRDTVLDLALKNKQKNTYHYSVNQLRSILISVALIKH